MHTDTIDDVDEGRLNEADLRKPGWHESACVGITLSDGQEWWFPKPLATLAPTFENGRLVRLSRTMFGPEYDTLVDGMLEGETIAFFSVAAFLLRQNYRLSDEDLSGLLQLVPNDNGDDSEDDNDCDQLLKNIAGVATGRPPKTYQQWQRCGLLIATGCRGPMTLEDARLILAMQVALGQLPTPADVCPELAGAKDRARLEMMGDTL